MSTDAPDKRPTVVTYDWRAIEPPPEGPADEHGRSPHAAATCRVDGGRYYLRATRYGGPVVLMEGAPQMIAVGAVPVTSPIESGPDEPPARFPTFPELQSAVQVLGPGFAWAVPLIIGHPSVQVQRPAPGLGVVVHAVGRINETDPANGRPSLVVGS